MRGQLSTPFEIFKAHLLLAQIDEPGMEIDALAYQLYGLMEEEIKMVEGKV